MKKLLYWLDKVTCVAQEYIMIIACIMVTALILTAAVMRYVFKSNFYGSEELILFTAFWLYFTGSISSSRDDTHINADMVSLFSKNKKVIRTVHIVRTLVSLVVVCLAVKWSTGWFVWSWGINGRSPVFKLPNVIAQFPIVLSYVFWLIYLVRDVVMLFKKDKEADKA